jgi:hypothetical protein
MPEIHNAACSVFARLVILLAMAIVPLSVALAQPNLSPDGGRTIKAFGHRVQLKTHDGQTSLSVDGKKMIGDAYLGVDKFITIDGTGVIIGSSRNGGASCDFSPFIIAFPKGDSPRFDGIVDPCANPVPKTTILKSAIVFETEALAGNPGKRWRWTPERGLQLEANVVQVASAGDGWRALKLRKAKYPNDLFKYKDLSRLIRQAVGEEWGKIEPALSGGPATMDYRGDLAVGWACEAHFCDSRNFFVVADLVQERLYIAWNAPENDDTRTFPPLEAWSDEAREAFTRWSEGQ